MEGKFFSIEQSNVLDDLIASGDEYAKAIRTLVIAGAGDKCASDEQTTVDNALELLAVDQDNLLLYSYWYEIDEAEKEKWLAEYEYSIDRNDENDVFQAWQSVVADHNQMELGKIAVCEFKKRLAFLFNELCRSTGMKKSALAAACGRTNAMFSRYCSGIAPVPRLIWEKVESFKK